MSSFFNINFKKNSIIDNFVYICNKIYKNFPIVYVKDKLKKKIKEAEIYISTEKTEKLKIKKLLHLFFYKWNFRGVTKKYKPSHVLWIHKVLKENRGVAISLGILLLHLAEKLHIQLIPILFPTQLILKHSLPKKSSWFINPLNGETLNKHILKMWIRGNISPTSVLKTKDLEVTKPEIILRKLLNYLKSTLIEEKKLELALKLSNVLIELNPNDPYEIRDRGLIYTQLKCYHIALSDLTYFVEQCPEDPVSEFIKIQINSIEKKTIVFH